ncbi:hypothetical protein TPA0906_44450 [Streptomyces olivaceus]|nr:hypothetical protein TPA0906_44450 [Streptomyces olivaceus]
MDSVSIANGWRAAKPGSRNVQAPRVRSSCPYPEREGAFDPRCDVVCGSVLHRVLDPVSDPVVDAVVDAECEGVTVGSTARAFLPPGDAVRRAAVRRAGAPRAVLLRGLR